MPESDPDIEAQLDALLDEVSKLHPSNDDDPSSSQAGLIDPDARGNDDDAASATDPIGADLADEIDGLLRPTEEDDTDGTDDDPQTVDELDGALAGDLEAALEGDFQSLSQILAEDDDPADALVPATPAAESTPRPEPTGEPAAVSESPETTEAPAALSLHSDEHQDLGEPEEFEELEGTFDDFETVAAETAHETSTFAKTAATSDQPDEPVGEMQSVDQILDAETAEPELQEPPAHDDEDDRPRRSVGAALDDLLGEDDTPEDAHDGIDELADDAEAFDQATHDPETADTEEDAEPVVSRDEPMPKPETAAKAPEPQDKPKPKPAPAKAARSETIDEDASNDASGAARRRIDPIAVLATINKPVAASPDSVRDAVGITALTTAFWGLFLIAYGLIGFNAAMAVAVLAVPGIAYFVIKSGPNAAIDDADEDVTDDAEDSDDTETRKAA